METKAACIAFILGALVGCDESILAGMEGRWRGTIVCFDGTAELTTHFTLEGDKLVGTAQTRFKDNNKSWQAKAAAASSCQEDTCRSSRDCPLGFDTGDANAGDLRQCIINPKCENRCKSGDGLVQSCDPCKNCEPCQICDKCRADWLPILLELEDQEVLVPDPKLKLWRIGSSFLKGSVRDYCANEHSLHPVVELHKD